jgi:acetyl esterase/lipase
MGFFDYLFTPYTVLRDKPYGPHVRHKLDVYTPKKATSSTPVLVFFHGGGFQTGNKSEYTAIADSFARAGYITIVPNYRLWTRDNPTVNRWPTQIDDGARAVKWVQAYYPGRKLFISGHSAGGVIVNHLNLDEQWLPLPVTGAIDLAGATDFTALGPTDLLPDTYWPEGTTDLRNATFHVTGSEPPMLLQQGLADEINYPSQQTELLANAFDQAGGVVEVKYYPGIDHVGLVEALARGAARPEVLADTLAWLAAH